MNAMTILVVMMSLFGCAQITSEYYYASLEGVSSVEVVSKSKIQLKNLEGDTEIPTSYLLKRNLYNLRFLIGNESYFPHFHISVEGLNGIQLSLRPRRDMDAVSPSGNICASYYPDVQNTARLDFGWLPNCTSEDIPKNISFDVLDENGNPIAQEDLPFTLKVNGRYTFLDAI